MDSLPWFERWAVISACPGSASPGSPPKRFSTSASWSRASSPIVNGVRRDPTNLDESSADLSPATVSLEMSPVTEAMTLASRITATASPVRLKNGVTLSGRLPMACQASGGSSPPGITNTRMSCSASRSNPRSRATRARTLWSCSTKLLPVSSKKSTRSSMQAEMTFSNAVSVESSTILRISSGNGPVSRN